MDIRSLLIFDLDGRRFGLDAALVMETVRLPELTPIEQAPPWIVGMFSLRGPIVAVVDLNLRMNRPTHPYRLEDQVVVVSKQNRSIGLIVGEVLEVVELQANAIQPAPEFETRDHETAGLSFGVVCVGEDLVTLIDVSKLTCLPDETLMNTLHDASCEDASPENRSLFHARALALRKAAAVTEKSEQLGLAVVELGGEYFGIMLDTVREFSNIMRFNAIPCCPPHILGVINIRGKLLTLIDPRRVLNLPPAQPGDKAVIVRVGDQAMGIAVDNIHDVIHLSLEDIKIPPATLREQFGADITGTATHAGKTLTVLDLAALLAREEWTVTENV